MSRNCWIIEGGFGHIVFTNRTAVWDFITENTDLISDPMVRFNTSRVGEKTHELSEKKMRAAFIKHIGEGQTCVDQYQSDNCWDGEEMVYEEWIDCNIYMITPAGLYSTA